MKIYTRTGDKGDSGLFGGDRVRKSSLRLHAYGTVDELNAILGMVLCEKIPERTRTELTHIQSLLFIVGSDLATPNEKVNVPRVLPEEATMLEGWIDEMEQTLAPLTNFILPGGCHGGAQLHQARTVCRRAERHIVALMDHETINPEIIIFMNRLSDYLFVAARFVNHESGQTETAVKLR